MIKSLVLSAVLAAGLSTVATAENAPGNSADCLKMAASLASTAESKKLPEAKIDSVEEMLTKMESHCDAKQFAEAAAVATSIQSVIEGPK